MLDQCCPFPVGQDLLPVSLHMCYCQLSVNAVDEHHKSKMLCSVWLAEFDAQAVTQIEVVACSKSSRDCSTAESLKSVSIHSQQQRQQCC